MAVLHYLINKKQFAKMYIECAWVGSKRLAEDSRDARVKRVTGRVAVLVIQLPACTCCCCCFNTYVYLLFLPLKSRHCLELSACRDTNTYTTFSMSSCMFVRVCGKLR